MKGQILVEMIIAAGVVMLGMLAVVQLSTRSLSGSGFTQRQATALSYTNRTVNWLKSEKNVDWDTFVAKLAGGGEYCITDPPSWVQAPCSVFIGAKGSFPGYTGKFVMSVYNSDVSRIKTDIYLQWDETNMTPRSQQSVIFTRY
jgi:Tfp pilus assembly protein PilV